jgi:hypothetical protein
MIKSAFVCLFIFIKMSRQVIDLSHDGDVVDLTVDDEDVVVGDMELRPRRPRPKPKPKNPRRVLEPDFLDDMEIRKKVPDYQVKPLLRFQRPYFSPHFNSYEMDYVNTGKFFDERNKTKVQNYLFVININTKYLISIPLPMGAAPSIERTMEALSQVFEKLLPKKIDSLRGDGDTAFGRTDYENDLNDQPEVSKRKQEVFLSFLRRNGVERLYLSASKFTNKNKCVDRVIRTIRDIIGMKTIRLLNPAIIERVVNIYNSTPHSAYLHKYSPNEVQNNLEIEAAYIRFQTERTNEIIKQQEESGLLNYKPGNVLMVHIPKDKTPAKFDKRRLNFSDLAVFVSYRHGNVVCELMDQLLFRNPRIELPIYYTKYLAEDVHSIPDNYKEAFIIRIK